MKTDAEIAAMIVAAVQSARFPIAAMVALAALFGAMLLGEGMGL